MTTQEQKAIKTILAVEDRVLSGFACRSEIKMYVAYAKMLADTKNKTEAAKFACNLFNKIDANPLEGISPELKADVQTFENEHEKLMESRNISLKPPVAISVLWDGGNDSSDNCFNFYYDADMIDNAVLQTKAFKDFQKETRKFCKKVEAWGDKNFGDPHWFFYNVLN